MAKGAGASFRLWIFSPGLAVCEWDLRQSAANVCSLVNGTNTASRGTALSYPQLSLQLTASNQPTISVQQIQLIPPVSGACLVPTISDAIIVNTINGGRRSMTWAERTYYYGKYGVDDNLTGASRSEASVDRPVRQDLLLEKVRKQRSDELGGGMPGSDGRLRQILESEQIACELCRYDSTALMYTGRDNSRILTNRAGWGIPIVDRDGYVELDNRFTCYWEVKESSWLPDPPSWAVPAK